MRPVTKTLTAWIAQDEERDRLTQEALADVDAGRVGQGCLSPPASYE